LKNVTHTLTCVEH